MLDGLNKGGAFMPEQSLKSYNFRIAYGPSDDRLQGFYIPALSRSIRYDCIAGFFPLSHWLLPLYPI